MTKQDFPKLYVVDVCGTLVHDDTTLGLLNYHFSRSPKRKIRRVIFYLSTARFSPLRLGFIVMEKLMNRHLLKHALVGLLAGDCYDELESSAHGYALDLLESRRISSVWKKLQNEGDNHLILLASASLEPVVKALANEMGAKYVASRLEIHDGILTGYYQEDLTGNKELAISKKYGSKLLDQPFTALSDNLSDRHMLARASKSFVIIHHERHRRRWIGLQTEYLKADE